MSDSPELAAIRADDERQGLKVLPQNVRNTFVQHLMTQRRALLRMVDELTYQLADQEPKLRHALQVNAEAAARIGELEAKLAEATIAAEYVDSANAQIDKLADENAGLKKKLAKAETEFALNLKQTVVVATLTGAAYRVGATVGQDTQLVVNELGCRLLVETAMTIADRVVEALTKKETP